MVHYSGNYYKKQNDFILNSNFAFAKYIRPPSIQNRTKWNYQEMGNSERVKQSRH